ncbi:MAG: hypothetical protein EA424_09780 [Planctomycetaceae bacterium]|nr:MAG: hypothetical protein EA424_09780 [Planctomycetaceae bacterium]
MGNVVATDEDHPENLDREAGANITGRNTSETYSHLSPAYRQAILEILRDTKPGLPDYWTAT